MIKNEGKRSYRSKVLSLTFLYQWHEFIPNCAGLSLWQKQPYAISCLVVGHDHRIRSPTILSDEIGKRCLLCGLCWCELWPIGVHCCTGATIVILSEAHVLPGQWRACPTLPWGSRKCIW